MKTAKLLLILSLVACGATATSVKAQNILLLSSQCGASVAHFPTVLNNLGLEFTETDSASVFLAELTHGTWDLVIVDEYRVFLTFAIKAEIGRYVESGGRVFISYWDWDFYAPLATFFDAGLNGPYIAPLPMRRWDAAHPLFNIPNTVPDLTPTLDTCATDGSRLRVIDRGYAVAGHTAVPTSGEAGVIVGNDGRTVAFGGIPGLFTADADLDGVLDMVEFLENAIRFLLDSPRWALVGLEGKCLDVEEADPTDGTPVILFRCNGGDNQSWQLDLTAAPQRVVGLGGKCLVPGPVDDSGDTRVVIGECGGQNGQVDLWRLEAPGPASPSRLVHVESGQCLDVEGAISDDLTPTILFDCHGDDNQIWRPAAKDCVRDWRGLCLSHERFRIDLEWRSFDGSTGSGRIVQAGSDDSGLLWFFEADNWEMLIKVLDGCGINNRFWVFAAATTTVEYTLRVTDTATGRIQEYFNPLGEAASAITDTDAFATCSAATTGAVELVPSPGEGLAKSQGADFQPVTTSGETPLKGSCVASATTMCLSDGRFQIEAQWRDFSGNLGSGQVVPIGSPDSGLIWFFNSQNWEVLIKVLDACDNLGHFLMLAAATTDVEYTLRVTDTRTGVFRDYFNPLGTASPALVDIFETCP